MKNFTNFAQLCTSAVWLMYEDSAFAFSEKPTAAFESSTKGGGNLSLCPAGTEPRY